jgi:hypothetical protein
MKRKWYLIISASIIIAGLALYVIIVKSFWRINLYDTGDGSLDQEIASMGPITINFGFDFTPKLNSYWERPGTEFLIKDSLKIDGSLYKPGDRLFVNEDGKLIKEEFLQSLFNDIHYLAWKLKNPDKFEQKTFYIRGEGTELRLAPNQIPRESLILKFGDEVRSVDQSGDWIKIVSEKPKRRGWIHNYTVTESKEQIEMLKKRNRIPKLIMLFSINKNGELTGTTLAGHYQIKYNKGQAESSLNKNDCLVFEKASAGKFQMPFALAGGYKIKEPLADKIYMLDSVNNFISFDITSFK